MKPGFPALQADSLPSEPPGKLFSDFQTFQIIKFGNNSLCYCYSLFAKSYPTVWNPTGCSKPGFPVHHQLPELAQTHVHRVGDAIQPSHTLSSLFLLPSIFPSIRVFSNESILCIRWPSCSYRKCPRGGSSFHSQLWFLGATRT